MLINIKRLFCSKRTVWTIFSLTSFIIMLTIQSCSKENLEEHSGDFFPKLSDYGIYKGISSDLIPADDMVLYELATPLFTDYSEKQRIMRIPAGQKIQPQGDGLPDFPEGTLIFKTFYYFNIALDPSRGKKIIETRVLLKKKSEWKVATYLWNDSQNDAF